MSETTKLIIICVETKNKKHATDTLYIKPVLDSKYNIFSNSSIKIYPIYFNGKGNYNKTSILKKIKELLNNHLFDEKHVVYFIDTDKYESNTGDKEANKKICEFCRKNKYKLVWFCHDIEEVFLMKSVPQKQKIMEAGRFNRKGLLDKSLFDRLSSKRVIKFKSNLLLIFDEILKS